MNPEIITVPTHHLMLHLLEAFGRLLQFARLGGCLGVYLLEKEGKENVVATTFSAIFVHQSEVMEHLLGKFSHY